MPMEQSEIDMLSNKHRDIAEHYGRRFVDYMSFNTNKYPEYFSNNNDDMQPQKMHTTVGGISKRYRPKRINLQRLKRYIDKLNGKPHK